MGQQHVGKGGNWEAVYQRMRPQDLDDRGKARLPETQWRVGDLNSPDTTAEVRP